MSKNHQNVLIFKHYLNFEMFPKTTEYSREWPKEHKILRFLQKMYKYLKSHWNIALVQRNHIFEYFRTWTNIYEYVRILPNISEPNYLNSMKSVQNSRPLCFHSWSQGLLFHQGAVDCGRAAILLPLGFSILRCEPIRKCSLVETAFLLLVTVSTINMLTTVLNDSPVFPEDGSDEDLISGPLLMDSPQCVLFGTFMIWFASITINLGPTFLSGALAARSEMIRNAPSCPLVHGPFRHYILNALWIAINVICVLLTLFHLHKLHRDLTKANVEAVKVAGLVTTLVNVTGSNAPIRAPGANSTNQVGNVSEIRSPYRYRFHS